MFLPYPGRGRVKTPGPSGGRGEPAPLGGGPRAGATSAASRNRAERSGAGEPSEARHIRGRRPMGEAKRSGSASPSATRTQRPSAAVRLGERSGALSEPPLRAARKRRQGGGVVSDAKRARYTAAVAERRAKLRAERQKRPPCGGPKLTA